MTARVFIGGSRSVTQLPLPIRQRLDNLTDAGHFVLIGDANGADKAVQGYLQQKGYRNVQVFCTGHHCRNNLGQWPTRQVDPNGIRRGTREYYTAKDRAMTEDATVGMMLWNGESVGTLANVLRLLRQGKKVAVYVSSERRFLDLRTAHDWSSLPIPAELRDEVEHSEPGAPVQRGLF